MLTDNQIVRLRAAARRGGVRMDEKMPGWAGDVNPDTLRMQSTELCILGQSMTRRSYLGKIGFLGLTLVTQTHYGFALDVAESTDTEVWAALTDAWRDEIKARTTTPVPVTVEQNQDDLVLVG